MKKIRALFIGKNSLGYEHGKTYFLRIWSQRKPGIKDALILNLNVADPILIARDVNQMEYDGGGLCPYSSIGTFLENWTDIRVVKEKR